MLYDITDKQIMRAVEEGIKEIICDDGIVKALTRPIYDHIDWVLEDCEVKDE